MGEGESSPRFLKGLSANLSLGLDHSISPNQWITDPLSQSWVRSLIEWGNFIALLDPFGDLLKMKIDTYVRNSP
jgi:hypothetical protein